MSAVDSKTIAPLIAAEEPVTPMSNAAASASAAAAVAVPTPPEVVDKEVDATNCDETSSVQMVEQIPEEPEPWGDILRRIAKQADMQVRDRVRKNLEGLMHNGITADHINKGKIKFAIARVGIPKQATLTDGCEWKALVDDWADGHKLQATFHPISPACFCIQPTASKLSCTCTPKITLSW
jgi:hypothetical protein